MAKEDAFYLEHILMAIAKLKEYTKNKTFSEFQKNSLLQDGVVRQLEIIGEAAKQLSLNTKEKAIKVPWKDIAGMRDKLIHAYFGVDVVAVWKTAMEDIPSLEKEIKKIRKG